VQGFAPHFKYFLSHLKTIAVKNVALVGIAVTSALSTRIDCK